MQVHYDTDNLPEFQKAVITIGTFDGVHTGHRQILSEVVQKAMAIGGESVLITFHPHPRMVLANQNSLIKLINTLDERIALLASAGIDHVVIIPFTADFASQSAESYIGDFLVAKFNPHAIVIGYDHRFGKNRTGNFQLLELMQAKYSYQLVEIPEAVIANNAISSTQIRKSILNGDMHNANLLLGYTYFFSGEIVSGNKMGRTIGYPTANINVTETEKLIPHNGVYAVALHLEGENKPRHGMMNIGNRPTIADTQLTIEAHIFDFSGDIYNQIITVQVHEWMRHEQKFPGLDALKHQLKTDEVMSRGILAKLS